MTFDQIYQSIKDFREPTQDFTTKIYIYAPAHQEKEIRELVKGSVEVKVDNSLLHYKIGY
jgi:hypothetical protein